MGVLKDITDAQRVIAARIIRENAKWARQRGMTFTAEEREHVAERIENSTSGVDVEMYYAIMNCERADADRDATASEMPSP
jgi:Zn-dependent alcohol dehydrogenase